VSAPPAEPHPALRATEQRDTRPAIEAALLPALFEVDAVGMIAVDPSGAATAVSPNAEKLLGYLQAELLGSSVHAALHYQTVDGGALDPSACPIVLALAENRTAEGSGEIFIRKDGTAMTVDWAVAPIVLAGLRTGGVIAFFESSGQLRAAVREVARLSAVTAANLRLGLLADATHALASAPDSGAGLEALARLLVPVVADWVVIDTLDPDTGVLERAALVHRDPDLEVVGRSTLGHLPTLLPEMNSPLPSVLAGGPTVHSSVFPAIDAAPDQVSRSRLQLFQALGAGDTITAPLRTRTRTLGAITAVRAAARPTFGGDDAALVSELASRAAYAVENAWLLQRQRLRAEEMQRALLPTLPPTVGAVELSGIYRPASDLAQVGGDWYDAFALGDGSIAVVIGDVAGHDLHSATRMGAARHKLRAIAGDRLAPPSEVLWRLDAVLALFAPEDLVTVIYGRLLERSEGWALQWSVAGHPPPLYLAPGEAPRLLTGEVDPPLGVGSPARTDRLTQLAPGAALVFYTDGLYERPGEDLLTGLERLVEAAATLPPEPALSGMCSALLGAMAPSGRDDVALLGVRVPGLAASPAPA
jgi:PAS domain S-box-containing protein